MTPVNPKILGPDSGVITLLLWMLLWMLLCLKEHSTKGSQELTFCTRIGIGFAIVEMAHSHSMAKKLSKKLSKELSKKLSKKLSKMLSKKHSKKQNFDTRIGPQLLNFPQFNLWPIYQPAFDGTEWTAIPFLPSRNHSESHPNFQWEVQIFPRGLEVSGRVEWREEAVGNFGRQPICPSHGELWHKLGWEFESLESDFFYSSQV